MTPSKQLPLFFLFSKFYRNSISLILEKVNIFFRFLEIFVEHNIIIGGRIMNTIGTRIKERRKNLGFTQLNIKELTGISSGNMSDIENGKCLPTASALIKLSKTLNCSIDWILTGTTSCCEEFYFSDIREHNLILGFRNLPKEEQEEFLGILDLKLKKIQTGNY